MYIQYVVQTVFALPRRATLSDLHLAECEQTCFITKDQHDQRHWDGLRRSMNSLLWMGTFAKTGKLQGGCAKRVDFLCLPIGDEAPSVSVCVLHVIHPFGTVLLIRLQ